MNKKVLFLSTILLTLCLITIVIFNSMSNDENNIIFNINKDEQVISGNMITMMYETEAGSGEYTETVDNTWPETGYIFNESLSGCENGGELEYNSGNNTVNLLSNSSDRCYVYFDKYDGVWIDNVSITNVTGSSVTLDVSATSENGNITTYYYSLNDNEEYQDSTSNVITINDLNKLTEYKISIYAVDSTNAKSNIYEISVSTTDISVPVINSVSVSNIGLFGFTLNVNAISENNIIKYYYIIDSNDLAGITANNNYTFTNLTPGTSYNIVIYAKDENDNISNGYKMVVETEYGVLLADYIKSLYTDQGSNGIYYHISSLANSAGDNSYRYAGANPNNYVCFGSNVSPCPDDNLYRIIGIFGSEVKLIKYDYAQTNLLGSNGNFYNSSYTSVYWGSSSYYKGNLDQSLIPIYKWTLTEDVIWSSSNLNKINLNQNYLNNIGNSWASLISFHNWKSGDISYKYGDTAKNFFSVEQENNSNGTLYNAKIGLMYVSDYGYAVSPEYWTTRINGYNSVRDSNWLFMGLYEWTITVNTNGSYVWYVGYSGSANSGYPASTTDYHAIRPCFYLDDNVKYIGGSGTSSDPYRIGI